MRWLAGLGLLLSACRCGSPPPRAEDVRQPHYAEWERLVTQAALGDVETATLLARDLTEGEAAAWDGAGGEAGARAVGGALGFLQIAESRDDLADGLPTAASGCATCHVGAGVQPRADRPEWAHETAAAWAAWGVVFSRSEPPPPRGDPQAAGAAPVIGPPTEDSLGQLLVFCQDCHATETPGSR